MIHNPCLFVFVCACVSTKGKYLNLSQNDLRSCGGFEAVAALQELEMLDVSSNDIASVDGVSSTSLTWLNLAGNDLIRLVNFGPLPSLVYLDLSSNDILDLNGLLSSTGKTSLVPKLEALDISNNNLKSNGGALNGLKRLKHLEALNMDDNDLIDVKEVIAIVKDLPRLKFISAVENDFTEEDEVLLENYCRANDIECEI